MVMYTANDIQVLLKRQNLACARDGIPSITCREDRIRRAIRLIADNRNSLCEAMQADFHCRAIQQSLMTDILASLASLDYAHRNIKKWIKPESRRTTFPLGMLGARAQVMYQPKGVVGAISTWNFPVWVPFSSLGSIFAAGNRCMIKVSECTPETSLLLQRLVGQYFDEEELVVITGDSSVAEIFASMPFDHLLFTGSTAIGKKVMKAAADNLVPVTLELGGKSPVVIGKNADIKKVAMSLVRGKMMNAGQVCLSPDYVFVRESWLNDLIAEMERSFEACYPEIVNNPEYCSIINTTHYDRLTSYLDDAKTKQGEIWPVARKNENHPALKSSRKLPLTLVINPTDDMKIMQEEIFGPLLPVKSYRHIDEAIEYIAGHPKPLALYYYGDDQHELQRVLSKTSSGGVTINDVIQHVGCDDLPFGGIGASGMGSYHGVEGFRNFSHARSVYTQARWDIVKLAGLTPPYKTKATALINSMIDRLSR